MSDLPTRQAQASAWFRSLRGRICAEFEQIEREASDARFTIIPWSREEGGGGEMGMMKGKIFEKVGVNISTVYGKFSEAFQKEMPGKAEMPYFWATGISLVAHMASPKVPAVHMNTRMIVVSESSEFGVQSSGSVESLNSELRTPNSKSWFGGGADLNPMVEDPSDTADFHAALQAACDAADPEYYAKYRAWCDEYFYIKHRNESRGVGGIFYDYLDSGNWEADFAFTRSVGEAFLAIYPELVRRHMHTPFTEAEREHQLRRRGRYAEFNLLYDRGTRFGLMTGGNPEAILMSLPPVAKWD